METKIKFLSHASCTITTKDSQLIIDPWLIGSCYWRSWWNYPPIEKELIKELKPSAIYITHVHWDHWHGPTLKKLFDKNILIITHREPNGRSVKDLHAIGFKNIKLLNHGESFNVGDIKITPYQFGLFLNDSALVVETKNLKLLNANDCKIAGASLRHLLNKHGRFDFALRSHSSANDRVCYKIRGDENFSNDNALHYSRSFKLFMDAVNPKFAIPFASNHVYLHKDAYHFNKIVNDPYTLKDQIQEMGGMGPELKIMLTGDSWSSNSGFHINLKNENYFLNKDYEILQYKNIKADILNAYYKNESMVSISNGVINKFKEQIHSIPSLLRLQFKNWEFCLELFSDTESEFYLITPNNANITKINKPCQEHNALIRVPKKIFKDAVLLNMFHHSSISKRNEYIFKDYNNFKKFEKFQKLLELIELQVFPISFKYIFKISIAYSRRWRELIVYLYAFVLRRKGMPIYDIEEEILKST